MTTPKTPPPPPTSTTGAAAPAADTGERPTKEEALAALEKLDPQMYKQVTGEMQGKKKKKVLTGEPVDNFKSRVEKLEGTSPGWGLNK
jgi:hypothetical protein